MVKRKADLSEKERETKEQKLKRAAEVKRQKKEATELKQT